MSPALHANGTQPHPPPRFLRLTFHGVPLEACVPHAPGARPRRGRAESPTPDQCSASPPTGAWSPVPDPCLLNQIVSLLLDSPSSIPELASSLNLTVLELIQITQRPEVVQMIQGVRDLAQLRADTIAAASRAQAMLALQTLVTTCAIDTPRDREATRLAASAILRYKPDAQENPVAKRRPPRRTRRRQEARGEQSRESAQVHASTGDSESQPAGLEVNRRESPSASRGAPAEIGHDLNPHLEGVRPEKRSAAGFGGSPLHHPSSRIPRAAPQCVIALRSTASARSERPP